MTIEWSSVMSSLAAYLAIFLQAAAVAVVASARRPLGGTALTTAWGWALAFSLACLIATVLDLGLGVVAAAWTPLLWYLVAMLALCPGVAALGARRPVIRAWTAFVVVPLLAVLSGPAVVTLTDGLPPGRFVLEGPTVVVFAIVLVMAFGNYVGTCFGWAAGMAATAEALFLLSLSDAPLRGTIDPAAYRAAGAIGFGVAAVLARRRASRRGGVPPGLDRVWNDFANNFGIVWARRIMDRFNQQARRESQPLLLGRRGFVGEPGLSREEQRRAETEAERSLRWLLRRFVDEEWIDARLGRSTNAGDISAR